MVPERIKRKLNDLIHGVDSFTGRTSDKQIYFRNLWIVFAVVLLLIIVAIWQR